MGIDVAMVEMASQPLEPVLRAVLARFHRDMRADADVDLHHLGAGVKALRGGARMEEVVLSDGIALTADAVVMGSRSGLGRSWPKPPTLRLTTTSSSPGTWPSRFTRYSATTSAWSTGPLPSTKPRPRLTTGSGSQPSTSECPSSFPASDDVGMEYAGYVSSSDQVIFWKETSSCKFIAFWPRDGAPAPRMHVNT